MKTEQEPEKPVLLDRLIDQLFDTGVAIGESTDIREQVQLSARADELKNTIHRLWISAEKVCFKF
jgi:hypothetical protein